MDPRVAAQVITAVIFFASIPIDAWLWRSGKISDNTATIVLLGAVLVLVTVPLLLNGIDVLLVVVLTAALLIVDRWLLYPFIRTMFSDLRQERARSR